MEKVVVHQLLIFGRPLAEMVLDNDVQRFALGFSEEV